MPATNFAGNWSDTASANVFLAASGADWLGSSHVRWKAISLSLNTARTTRRSIAGLKFRGSTMTCPISGMLFGATFVQYSAFGSSGMSPVTPFTVTSVA